MFLLQGSRNGYSSAIAAAPLAAKGRQRDFTVGTLSPVQYWPSTNPCGVWQSKAKQVAAKIATAAAALVDASAAAAAVLSERKCGGAGIWA